MRRHLWYLTPELVVLALFDDGLPEEDKQQMADTLLNTPNPAVFNPGKPAQPNFDPVAAHLGPVKPSLSDFISERSWMIFTLVDATTDWLNIPPSQWIQDGNYQHLRSFIRDLQVVNDAAERAVKDVAEYSEMTQDPNHRDAVILVANDHRGRVAQLRKANLNNV